MKSLLTTKASTTEEPREGKLHAGICAGDAEQSVFLPRLCKESKVEMINDRKKIELVTTTVDDLEALFVFQLDKEANYLAAFTSKDPTDKTAYIEKWAKLITDKSINMQTILFNSKIVGNIAKYEIEGDSEITYWIGKDFWGQGIATSALKKFLNIEIIRPIYGRVAFDNFGSQKVLEKCGFKKVGTDKGFANAREKEIEEIIFELIDE